MRHFVLASLCGIAFVATAVGADEYRVDDGVTDLNVGVISPTDPSVAIGWLNRFVVQPGETTITDINVAFGSVAGNEPVEVHLWTDPNNDGDPSDAFSLASVSGFTANTGTNTFVTFDIPDTTLSVGDNFFVGAIMNDLTTADRPAALDLDGTDTIPNYPPNNHSWIVGDTDPMSAAISPNSLDTEGLPVTLVSSALGQDGNWLVRANAVPEPTAAVLLLIGAGLLRPRR